MKMKKPLLFSGVATALYTPFTTDGENVDFGAFERLIERQLNAKINALVFLGTTGEAPTVSPSERRKIISFAVKTVNGRVPVIIGAGSNCTSIAAALSREAEDYGADAVLSVTPYYNKCNETGLINHYASIAKVCNVPIIVYDVPTRTGVNVRPETYAKLAKINSVIAVKEADPDTEKFKKSIRLAGDDLVFYCGSDEAFPSFQKLGAVGSISVASNIIPDKILDVYLKNREFYDCEKNLINALFSDVNPIMLKYAVEKIFGEGQYLRLPLTRADKRHRDYLNSALKEFLKES